MAIAAKMKKMKVLGKGKGNKLHAAAQKGRVDDVEGLIAKGTDKNAIDKNENTPVMVAAANGHPEFVRKMCEKGIDLLAQNDKGWTALHLAAANRHVDCVDVLLEYMDPQHIDMLDAQRRTALHEAVKAKSTECIASLLASKANVLSADRGGKTCLHMAAFIGYFQGMKQLVDAGLPVDTPSNNGNTALHVAAHLGHPRCTKELLALGASADAANVDNLPPRAVAVARLQQEKNPQRQQEFRQVIDLLDGQDVLVASPRQAQAQAVSSVNMGSISPHDGSSGPNLSPRSVADGYGEIRKPPVAARPNRPTHAPVPTPLAAVLPSTASFGNTGYDESQGGYGEEEYTGYDESQGGYGEECHDEGYGEEEEEGYEGEYYEESNSEHELQTSNSSEFQAKALYAYKGQYDYELSLSEGEIITVTNVDEASGWWMGKNANGVTGPFPGNYVERL